MSEWPELSVERDHETLAILHLAAQMLGKIRVAHAPWMNHGWHVALQPNARGLSTLPTAAGDGRTFTLRSTFAATRWCCGSATNRARRSRSTLEASLRFIIG